MNKLEALFNLAQKENIGIHWVELKEIGCLGLNVEKKGLPHMIFLDNSLRHDNELLLEIFSHELGHYFTTVGNFIKGNVYSDSLQINKVENKANRWACEFLITEDEIITALNKNISTCDELADYLGVSTTILLKRLEYLALQKQMLDLSYGKYLILTNLPNFYIYNTIN